MTRLPFYPLNVEAARTEINILPPEVIGAHYRMLLAAWLTPDCRLPNDDAILATIAGVSRYKWNKIKTSVLTLWVQDDKYLSNILQKFAQNLAQERSKKAKASAEAKWLKINNSGYATASSEHSLEQTKTDAPAHATITYNKKDSKTERKQGRKISPPGSPPKVYFYENNQIRLNEQDFLRWQQAFPLLNLRAELEVLADWEAATTKNWFHAVRAALAKRHREISLQRDAIRITAEAAQKPQSRYFRP